MNNEEIISLARATLDQCLYHGNGHITRATDSEIILFARAIESRYANYDRFKDLLRQIAFPKRGTDEERMDIFEAAELIAANFSREDLVED